MTEPAKGRSAERVYSGMLPPFFDRVVVSYPSATTEEYTYSALNPDTGTHQITAIIEISYTDNTKDFISMIQRLL